MAVKAAAGKHSAPAHSGRGERVRRDGGGVVGGEDAREPCYRVRGGAGLPGIGEERAPAVVHHNGFEGGRFWSGIGRGVMGGGENVLRPLWKRKGEGHREAAAHARAGGGGDAVLERLEEEDEREGAACQRGREAGWAKPAGRPRSKRSGGGVACWSGGGGSGSGRGGGREVGGAGWAKGQVDR
jgi:hypothetical protein